MAKDGTARGGYRAGAGRKSNKSKARDDALVGVTNLVAPDEIVGLDVPPVSEFLKAKQKDGKDLQAEKIYKNTYAWLRKRGCDKLISSQLVEQYAMSVSRWIQCEEAISNYGFLAKHPTTGNAIASPYVQMSQTYMKQINATWYQIYSIVRDNGASGIDELDEQDLRMEALLNAKGY